MKTWRWILLIGVALGAWLVEWLAAGHGHENGHEGAKFPGFWIVFGLAGTMFLVGLARLTGKGVQRREDYYDRT